MATSTFDKRIVIDNAAADVLIALLNKPAPPYPDINGYAIKSRPGENYPK
jgi:hypothetical protein